MEINKLKNILNFFEKKVNRTLPDYNIKIKFLDPNHKWTEEELNIKGGLDLADTKITTLPNNLKVGGGLNLDNTKITSLPNNLTVGGDLWLENSKITSLPNNLKVGGSLWLEKSKITSLPSNLTVGGAIFIPPGNIKLSSVPNHLKDKIIVWR